MRNIVKRLSLLAAALMILAVPVLAYEGTGIPMTNENSNKDKNECLLVARNCTNQVDSIQERITKIRKEISRGEAVYTKDELRQLNNKLEEANKTLEYITTGT
jgi:peptidoglycan hydrolase CwlO-like protein